jgi:sterol desaturase/sphingolipid hydroxylase (fatty acid hydroxylase superfamily)
MTSNVPSVVSTGLTTIAGILGAMAVVALIEAAIPLHPRGRWNRAHLGPNLALTFVTFATNLVFNAAVVVGLIRLEARGVGLLHWFSLPPLLAGAVVLVGLDFSFYLAHVAMHASPVFWRMHRVHHSDPAVDVTTTIRQHPGEGVLRYAFMAAFAFALGAPPGAFAVYRLWSVLSGLLNHANIRVPRRLDTALSLVFGTPNMHKLHHSRARHQANTNYGTIFSLFDRVFGTFTPSEQGVDVVYGLAGFDDPVAQSTRGLLGIPFRHFA